MPEMPEVETVKRELNKNVKDKKIVNIEVYFNKLLKNVSEEEFINLLVGQTIKEVRRKGKYLIIDFSRYLLLVHLRMEGKLFYYVDSYQPQKHDHVVFKFEDGSVLVYNDVRKFGTFDLILSNQEQEYKKINKLGIEPLTKDFTVENLYNMLRRSSKKIKQALLDQEIVSGLGNIYVDEVLYASKIHPEQIAKTLTKEDIQKIVANANTIIKLAIENNGTTIKSFSASDQIKGKYQDFLKVYFKNDTECQTCGDIIKKMKVGGRGTHYCPTCQRLK